MELLDPARVLPVRGSRHRLGLDAGPLGVVVAVNQTHDLGPIGGRLATDHEPDRLALLDAEPVAVADNLHSDLSALTLTSPSAGV